MSLFTSLLHYLVYDSVGCVRKWLVSAAGGYLNAQQGAGSEGW